ncbi:hypothetical protein C8J45_103346 [Sphingomonas sp. PP-CE-3G-477]|uniref:hypothetical protein n=1 Tax=Sphingomonas sp. PP-CE-3G-477 TaxID=2135660 RepID=UPI000D4624A0|nr:hypothetical protein [Sphingomonas sp. PP-CE-3G-477]PTQ64496.1 hypothetical protein C8J45_103346 [Sphingomonas sp. PP-CE-3G-477]
MKIWPFTTASAAPTPADAARTLGAIARKNAADRRTAMLTTLRGCVARGDVAKLGWKA